MFGAHVHMVVAVRVGMVAHVGVAVLVVMVVHVRLLVGVVMGMKMFDVGVGVIVGVKVFSVGVGVVMGVKVSAVGVGVAEEGSSAKAADELRDAEQGDQPARARHHQAVDLGTHLSTIEKVGHKG